MGNKKSVAKPEPIRNAPQHHGQQSQGMLYDAKKILMLHKSNSTQLRAVRNFRNALTAKANGTIDVTNFVNIADGNNIPKNRAWLEDLNNVVIICLTSEAIEEFQRIILEKGFANENGQLHEKVFSVTFGESLDCLWPPKGLKKGSRNLRDFHFGFTDTEKIRPQDFERSLRLSSLIAAMNGTK